MTLSRFPRGVRRRTAVLALLVASSGLVACSAGGPPETGRPTPSPRPEQSDALLRELAPAEARLLHDAEQVAMRDCMARLGFTLVPTPLTPVPELRDFPYVLDDAAWARRNGYGTALERRAKQAAKSDPNRRYFASLAPGRKQAAVTALNGDRTGELEARLPTGGLLRRSDDGCTSEAERRVYGDLPTWYRVKRVFGALVQQRRQKVTEDPRFTAAVAAWARCMARAGHAYASPVEARSAGGMAHRPLAQAAEISLAVAEATCAGTGLAATAQELDRRYAEEILAGNRETVAAKRRLEREALPRARTIVGRD